MKAKDLANKLLEFYDNKPERWTKDYYARDKDGNGLDLGTDPAAVCWCMAGAMQKMGVDWFSADTDLREKLGGIRKVNDACVDFDELKTKLEAVTSQP